MQVQSNSIRIKRRSIFYFVITILALGIVTPALAAYLGPNRVVTGATGVCKVVLYECQYVPAKDDHRYKKVGDWSCSNESKPWQAYPSDPSSQGCFNLTEGDTYWSREETLQEVTTSYPPATINSSLQNCTLNNGWCNTAPVLSLSGNEPVTGYNILAIEGTLNGQTFACSGTNCSVPLNQGNNDLTFWALSSWGDTSEMGSVTAKVDSTLPTITGTLSGTVGSNGWYISPVSFIGSASDTTSGLASFTCTFNNIGLPSCNSLTVNTAGAHSLVLTARDNAGNTRLLTQNASVDLHNPSLTASLIGIMGSNNWYNSASLNGSASDPVPGSGLSVFQYNQDGGGWVSFPVSGELALSDGKHSIDIRAIDNAGRTVSSSKSFWLDSIAPELIINPSGTMGMNNWYTSGPLLTASASDNTSGMDIFEYSLDSGAWTSYSSPLVLSDGVHVLSFWAQDVAGLVTQVERTYQVDTRAPHISGSLSGVPGASGWYTSDVTLSAAASDPTPGSGLDAFTYTLNSASENPYTDPLILSDGIHTVQLDAQDKAGWTYSSGQSIKVDTLAPALRMQTTLPNWISNIVTVEGTASDPSAASSQPSSGLSKVEVSTDRGQTWQPTTGNGSWSYAWDTAQNLNGVHELHIRATDNAGLTTEQTSPVGVDNAAPKISLPDSWYQWDTVTLDIWDNDSGLAEARVEISDPEGRWPTRKINLGVENFPMDFKWDRRFGDGTVAPLGTYDIEVIAFDSLSNMARQNADINILLGILPAGPASTPQPYVRTESTPLAITTAAPLSPATAPQNAVVSAFGSTPEVVVSENVMTQNIPPSHVAPTQTSVLDWLESIFVPNQDAAESESIVETADEMNHASGSSASDVNVLWGATAAAMIGAATAYALDEKRKREEEMERNRAEIQARIDEQYEQKIAAQEARKVAQWLEGQAILKAEKLQQLEMADVTNEERLAAHKQSEHYLSYQARMEDWHAQQDRLKALETADMTEAEKLAAYKATDEYQERQSVLEQYHHEQRIQAAETARWEGLASQGQNAANMPRPSWWEKAIDWVDEHQVAISLGVGLAVGVAAIILSGGVAAPLVAAAWMAGAAAIAGGTIALGTIGLNAYYGRDWNENVLRNLTISAVAAGAITGLGFLLSGPAMITMGNSVAGYCANHPEICVRVDVVLKTWDKLEEVGLIVQGTVQTLRGDSVGAAQTQLELQLEHLDGGVPGNTLVLELGEQLTKLGDDTAELITKHSDEAADLITTYGADVVELLSKHEDKVIELLERGTPSSQNWTEFVPQDYQNDILSAFEDEPIPVLLNQDVTVYRYWSGDTRTEVGRWVTVTSELTPEEARKLLALPDSNSAINKTQFTIPAETTVLIGEAAEQTSASWAGPYATGGGFQIYLPDPSVLIK